MSNRSSHLVGSPFRCFASLCGSGCSQSLARKHSPICSREVPEQLINRHLDANCRDSIPGPSMSKKTRSSSARPVAPIFKAGGPASHGSFASQQSNHRPAANKPSQKRELSGDVPRSSARIPPVKRSKPTIGSHLQAASPLAERLRPNTLDEFVGQIHLTGSDSFLSTLIEKGALGSIILWGPPG
jgi:putative ATPase